MLDSIIAGAKADVGFDSKPSKKSKTQPAKVAKKETRVTNKVSPNTKSKSKVQPKPTSKVEPEPKQEVLSYVINNVQEQPAPVPKEASLFELFIKNTDTTKLKLTDADMTALAGGIADIQRSFLGIVQQCISEECNHRNICPFSTINKYPNGTLCPLEVCIAEHASQQYFQLLKDELNSESFNIVETTTVRSLVSIEVEEFRARTFLNTTGMVTDSAAFAIRRTGEVIYNKTENPVYNIMERLSKRKQRLLQRLLVTPEAKAKYKIDRKDNRGSKTKELLLKAEEKIRLFHELPDAPTDTDT